ncbi:MAG: DHH family phosphoesterase [Oligoflexales bacterium]|nr:DHH family phosphoesterase [Oligoflexales bacterium]
MRRYSIWLQKNAAIPEHPQDVLNLIRENRGFNFLEQLNYGDYGVEGAFKAVLDAITQGKRIALYADYDVDGTMSCVSWIWFLEAIGYRNFSYYIPCRFNEGYGLNLNAIKKLIDEDKAELIITMDTGITANVEASYCRSRGVDFICTDHHKIQMDKLPDGIILNPKLHPDPVYQELCGCGVTFVLLRKLGNFFPVSNEVWTDILALVGMATICDVVPLNQVNHRLAGLGVSALMRSSKKILTRLREACSLYYSLDEKDVGYRVGPRINAVGRLAHADAVIEAFTGNDPEPLVQLMYDCNEKRKQIQKQIVSEASDKAMELKDDPIIFLGSDWHQGVVGIAASKVAERFWKPTFLFCRGAESYKGSARSIPGFDVTGLMSKASSLFSKFGGHAAAGGFSFLPENEGKIKERLLCEADEIRKSNPDIWKSNISYDCAIPLEIVKWELLAEIEKLRPFGHGFEEPVFRMDAYVGDVQFLRDKKTGEQKHTAVRIRGGQGEMQQIMFFNEVCSQVKPGTRMSFLVSLSKSHYRGMTSLLLTGIDSDFIRN